jgi:hypothetical protein
MGNQMGSKVSAKDKLFELQARRESVAAELTSTMEQADIAIKSLTRRVSMLDEEIRKTTALVLSEESEQE